MIGSIRLGSQALSANQNVKFGQATPLSNSAITNALSNYLEEIKEITSMNVKVGRWHGIIKEFTMTELTDKKELNDQGPKSFTFNFFREKDVKEGISLSFKLPSIEDNNFYYAFQSTPSQERNGYVSVAVMSKEKGLREGDFIEIRDLKVTQKMIDIKEHLNTFIDEYALQGLN